MLSHEKYDWVYNCEFEISELTVFGKYRGLPNYIRRDRTRLVDIIVSKTRNQRT